MLIVKLATEENGARANQVISPALENVPEGWAAIPPKLEEKAMGLLPWMTLRLRGGAVTGVGDDAAAREAAAKLAETEGAAIAGMAGEILAREALADAAEDA